MGVFKPLLPVGAQPAILRCVNTANAAGVADVIVVTGHMHEAIEDALGADAPGVRLVHNPGYMDGMFSSALAGVRALSGNYDGFFLLPADCCAVAPDTLVTLTRHFAAKGGASVTRPKFGGRRGHPPLIPARFRDRLLSYDGENGLKGYLAPLPTDEIEMDSPDSLLDMDTPEDYAELLGFLGLPAYPSRERCAQLFTKYNTPSDIIGHGESVAAIALEFALSMEKSGYPLDAMLLESACLTHDILRMRKDHAREGMELLLREGYPKAALLVGKHMDMPGFDADASSVGEAELLFLADKLHRRGKYAALEDTMRELEERFARDPEALAAAAGRIKTAQAIQAALSARYGISL